MSEITFERRIADEVTKQLNSGMVERLIAEKLEKGVSEALNDFFGYCGLGKKAIDDKVKEIMVPVIEGHDFNRYLLKLDACLSEIVNATSLKDNKKILENFKDLMIERDTKEIKLSDIFERYCRHVAGNVDTGALVASADDGDPCYEDADANMVVERENGHGLEPSLDYCRVELACEQDQSLSRQISLYKRKGKDKWSIVRRAEEIDINSLRTISEFEIFLSKISRAFVSIEIDTEYEAAEVEVEERPEYGLL